MSSEHTPTDSRVWFTWETQRRNEELAASFSARYLRLDYSRFHSLVRYALSISGTLILLLRYRPNVVFSQCPSLVLAVLLSVLRPLFRYQLVLDVHNIILDREYLSVPLVRRLVTFAFSHSAIVVVSNNGLFSAVRALGGDPVVLPDKIPILIEGPMPSRFEATAVPRAVLVSSYAPDEPLDVVLEAYHAGGYPGTLFVTGRRAKAGDLLKYESEQIIFTDFLSEKEFDTLLGAADLVIDVTTHQHCLVCGAYEALSAEVPMLLSDNPASKEWFDQGCVYAENTIASYKAAFDEFFGNPGFYRSEIQKLKERFTIRWNEAFAAVEAQLRDLVEFSVGHKER